MAACNKCSKKYGGMQRRKGKKLAEAAKDCGAEVWTCIATPAMMPYRLEKAARWKFVASSEDQAPPPFTDTHGHAHCIRVAINVKINNAVTINSR